MILNHLVASRMNVGLTIETFGMVCSELELNKAIFKKFWFNLEKLKTN